jgi:hypothetical protein
MPEKCLNAPPVLALGTTATMGKGMNIVTRPLRGLLLLALFPLAACSSGGNSDVSIVSGNAKPKPQPIKSLGAEEIRSTIIGRSWQYTTSDGSGFVTYKDDGTLSYQDDAKGQGSGTWSAVEGELCQSIGGKPTECGQFKSTGDAYYAGNMRLVQS